jgi:hypothetical protein
MSVSFSVEWPDGTFDDVPLFVESFAQKEWRRIAEPLKLDLLNGDYPFHVQPEMLAPLESEFDQLFDAISLGDSRAEGAATWQKRKAAIRELMRRMAIEPGWSAMVG